MYFSHFIIFVLSFTKYTTHVSSSNVERCNIRDDKCILKSANDILHGSSQGRSDIALSSIDPVKAEVFNVVQNSGPVEMVANFKNFEVQGLSNGRIYKFKGFDNNKLEIGIKTPSATLKGFCKVNGKILVVPVSGEGITTIKFTDLDIKMILPLTSTTRNGKTFYKIVNPKMTFDTSGGEVHLSHLNSFANGIINGGFSVLVGAVKEAISKPLVQLFTENINEVFDKTPAEELFL